MKARNTLIFLGIALLFGAYLIFWESKQELPSEAGEAPRKYLLEFETKDTNDVQIIAREGGPTHLYLKDGAWMAQDEGGKAYATDPAKISDYLETLRGIEAMGLVEEGSVNLSEYGLADPEERIVVAGKKGDTPWTFSLLLGGETPIGSKRYLTRDGLQAVYVLESYRVRQIFKQANDFRSKDLLHFNMADVRRMEVIHHAGGGLTLEHQGTAWAVAAGGEEASVELDPSKVDEFLDTLAGLRIRDFTGKEPKEEPTFGLGKPTLVYALKGADGAELARLEIGNREKKTTGDYYALALGEPEAVILSAFSVDHLPKTLEDLRPEPKEAEPAADTASGPPDESLPLEAPAGE